MTGSRPPAAGPGTPGADPGGSPADSGAPDPLAQPATGRPAWRPGRHYLAHLPVDLDGVSAIDVVAAGLDDDYQEDAALAKVRVLLEQVVTLDQLAEEMGDVLPADGHGPFPLVITPPATDDGTAEIRVTHGEDAGVGPVEPEEVDRTAG